jgi:hypothetical protein
MLGHHRIDLSSHELVGSNTTFITLSCPSSLEGVPVFKGTIRAISLGVIDVARLGALWHLLLRWALLTLARHHALLSMHLDLTMLLMLHLHARLCLIIKTLGNQMMSALLRNVSIEATRVPVHRNWRVRGEWLLIAPLALDLHVGEIDMLLVRSSHGRRDIRLTLNV